MTGPIARNPLPCEPEWRPRWRDARLAPPSGDGGLLRECRDLIAEFPPRGCGVDDLLRRIDAALNRKET